ncbi:mycofactocin biosynthesis peptidyl-dipeptidase MftE [Leifsonia sp. NPDC058230]|uniref:mycofactocin biosynthesis peptidyl-dipeptidase MftE n=1 Tax=Leifsonia sp. NPDC058230 TaxID=3346391 RepID=UPI0036DEC4C2
MSARLSDLAWPEVDGRLTVLLPLGSTEQHGPHLPFDTDTVIATAVAEGIAERLPCIVAPTLPFGSSGEHQDFPGTISIGRDALALVLTEAVRSIATWAGRVVLVTGHGGNVPTLVEVVPALIGQGHALAWIPCSSASTVDDAGSHAGHGETSVLALLRPGSVDLAKAEAGNVSPLGELLGDLTRDGVRSVAPTGVLGDPTAANARDGAEVLRAMVDEAVRRIRYDTRDSTGCLIDPDAGRA